MDETGRDLRFPTRADIVSLNRLHTQKNIAFHAGSENIRDESTLEWVLDAIRHPLFDSDFFPSTAEKAAALAWYLIKGHVFLDANKRTGFSAMLAFLDLNGYLLEASTEEFLEVSRLVASSDEEYTFEDFVAWIRSKLSLIEYPPGHAS